MIEKPAPSRIYYPGLDLVRFSAALLVALFHLGYDRWAYPHHSSGATSTPSIADIRYEEIAGISSVGWMGVAIFFILSGFVIALSAEHQNAARFLFKRSRRIFPALWICTAIGSAVLLTFEPASMVMGKALRSVILWPGGGWFDGVVWTLVVECQFYALVALFLVVRKRDPLPTVALACAVLNAIAFVLLWQFEAGLEIVRAFRVAQFGGYFSVGICLYLLTRRGFDLRIAALLIASFTLCVIETRSAWSVKIKGLEDAFAFEAALIVLLAGFAAIAISAARPASVVPGWIRLVGLTTYPLYLLHSLIGLPTIALLTGSGVSRYASLAVGIGASIAVSMLVATALEPWLQTRFDRVRRGAEKLVAQQRFSFSAPRRSRGFGR